MRVYLDDARPCPVGWCLAKTADECIEYLKTGNVEAISLDHDLAEEHYDQDKFEYIDMHGYVGECSRERYRSKTGYAVVEWMITNNVWPDHIVVHSMNPVGRQNMYDAIEKHAPHVKLEQRVGWSGRDD